MESDYFRGKKITVMGLGLLGRGVGDAEFLARHGAELIVTDLKSEEELATSLERLKEFPNISYTLGEHKLEDFQGRDLIIKAAGVPLDNPFIKESEKAGVPVEMSTALFADLSRARIVGVTGTRGKSTVTHMIHEALSRESEAGRMEGRVFLGGNVRGLSTLALLDEVTRHDTVVLELDSWQLQGFRSRQMSPHISVFTTFMPDHMNYYEGDLRAYFYDKSAVYEFQKEGDTLVVSEGVLKHMEQFDMEPTASRVRVVRERELAAVPPLNIPGEHNRLNAALALVALVAAGVEEGHAREHIAAFKGVPGRLEKIAEKGGVSFYNDTTATTPEAASAALSALSEQPITLIAGGSDKGLDFTPLLKALRGAKNIVFLPGAGTERLLRESAGVLEEKSETVASMEEAVKRAYELSRGDGVVLLSPGCASFGLFKNEFDRGDKFLEAVNKL